MFERKPEMHEEEFFASRERARAYAGMAEKSGFMYRDFLKGLAALEPAGRVLDVGAGPGVLASLVAQQHPEVHITALEVSDQMVEAGREYVAQKGHQERIQFVQGNAANQEVVRGLGTFDLVYCTYTLHHFKAPERVLKNLLSVVQDPGTLHIYDLRRVWWLYWIPLRSGFIDSIRAAYVASEVQDLAQRVTTLQTYEVKNHFPFHLSLTIRQAGATDQPTSQQDTGTGTP
jgi:ubiquinone/menaquinone biosynthesis C-methylase UbiE